VRGGPKWYNIHTKLHGSPSTGSNIIRTHARTRVDIYGRQNKNKDVVIRENVTENFQL